MFSLWSVVHFVFWVFVESYIATKWEPKWKWLMLYTVIASYAWEVFEYFSKRYSLEAWGLLEQWTNFWIGDPLCNLAGATFGWFVITHYRKRIR